MERLQTPSAQLGDLRAAVFMPELQSMIDTHPHASVKAKPRIRQAALISTYAPDCLPASFMNTVPCPSRPITRVNMDVLKLNVRVK